MLISEAFTLFRDIYIAENNLNHSTEDNYRVAVLSCIRSLGDVPLESLQVGDLLQWRRDMEARNKPGTVRGNLSKLKNILVFTNKRGLTCLDIDRIKLPKVPPGLPKYLLAEDVEKLIAAAETVRDKCMVSFMFANGIRCGELVRLLRDDVMGNRVFIRQGKCNKSRRVWLDDRTLFYLEGYLEQRKDNHPALFLSLRKKALRPARVSVMVKELGRKAGIEREVHGHVMRHSFATDMVANGADILHVQKMLGHQYVSTTQIYTHVEDPQLFDVYKRCHSVPA